MYKTCETYMRIISRVLSLYARNLKLYDNYMMI